VAAGYLPAEWDNDSGLAPARAGGNTKGVAQDNHGNLFKLVVQN
jgi:hypothetical protein